MRVHASLGDIALLAIMATISAVALAMKSPAQAAHPLTNPELATDHELLESRQLLIPVQGVERKALRDNFDERRSAGHKHEALDIMAPRGTPVLAVGDGKVAKLFKSVAGGLTVYQFDADEKFAYYYAHLDRYAPGLQQGQALKRGEVLGYVGSTGNAPPSAPHLHFTIFRLGPDKRWWVGTAINPYPFLVATR
ncbi:M23 family metallopeptidase [Usitatibacter palustris]|uniref:M23ase beta-sheet core domain-containing protein n=1 Tax=Usitatibacter palustris TaxID=2732487 RepID=A0A6M4H3A8_9PROT|nr:M23 family metallopeptidase [Usitatibacter palustris]QJR13825.1 hypothetical protein DSM104440_00615 [Usitatibacter palustris]